MAERCRSEVSLLERLAAHMECHYLSDLRLLDSKDRRRLARQLEKVAPETAALKEWNDALRYMTGDDTPRTNASLARRALIRGLRKK